MNQKDYETIIACIQYGAPALANGLVASLNNVVENSNNFRIMKKQQEDDAAKASQVTESKSQSSTKK